LNSSEILHSTCKEVMAQKPHVTIGFGQQQKLNSGPMAKVYLLLGCLLACTAYGDSTCVDPNDLWKTQDCSGLSKSCVASYSPDLFSTDVGYFCLQSLSADGASGLTSAQMAQISDTKMGAFTQQQIQAMDSSVFSGFSDSKTFFLNDEACAGMSADDLAQVPSSGMANFQSSCWANLPASSLVKLSSSQVGSINQGMRGFTSAQLSALPSNLCSAFTWSQLVSINADACSGLSLDCAHAMQIDAFKGLQGECFSAVPDSLFGQLNEEHFVNIGCGGFSGVNAQKFKNALDHLGTGVVDSLNYQKLTLVSKATINQFINQYWGGSSNLQAQSSRSLCSQAKNELSWLKVIYSSDESASCLNARSDVSEGPVNASNNLFSALRGGHVKHIPASFFQSAPYFDQFSDSFISSLSSNQVSSINPSALYMFINADLLQVNGPLQNLSPLQLSAIYNYSSNYLSCQVVSNFSAYQLEFYSTSWCLNRSNCKYDGSQMQCSHQTQARSFDVTFSSLQKGICDVSEDYLEFTWNTGHCEEHSGSSSGGASSSGTKPGIIAVAVLIPVLVLGGAFGYWYWKQKNTHQYSSLPNP
jgi:hypothetical protein